VALSVVVACGSGSDASGPASGAASSAIGTGSTVSPSTTPPSNQTGSTVEESTPSQAPGEPTTPSVSATVGGKLVVAVEAETSSPWTPANMQCDSSCQVRVRTVFEPLAAVDQSGQWRPYLAKTITSNDDATLWTISLRSGIKFHDGEPLNADAAMNNFNRAINSFLLGKALTYVVTTPVGDKVEAEMTKVDDLTFTIRLSKSWYQFPVVALSSQSGFMASPKWLAAADADPAKETEPVGTGPFGFVSYKPGNTFTVKRFDGYWQSDANGVKLPYLDAVEFRVIPDVLARSAALRTGALDLIHTNNGEQLADLRADSAEFPMVEVTDLIETAYLLMYVGKPNSPLNDRRVRCAIAASIDQEAIVDATQGGVFQIANGPFSPSHPGYLADTGYPGYNPELAKELLAEYTADKGAPPKLTYTATPDQASLTIAEIIQSGMTDAGFDVDVAQSELGALITNALVGDPSFDMFDWRSHAGFLDNQYVWWSSETAQPQGDLALNFGRVKDPRIDALLEQARSVKDPKAVADIAEQINKVFGEECYIAPYYWLSWGLAHTPNVNGFDAATFPDSSDTLALDQGFPGSFMLISAYKTN
jgi:peptide/nickel transport system substrate-binding protein